MSARQKLNQSYIQGCLLLASVVGFVCESWTVFWIAAAIFAAGSLHSGEIRLSKRSAGQSSESRPRRFRRLFRRRR